MKLYQVGFEGEHEFVEAMSFGQAVALWREEMERQNPDWDADEADPRLPVGDGDARRPARRPAADCQGGRVIG